MPTIRTPLEMALFDALKRITKYDSASRLLKHGERDWGCSGNEALEMAYENIQQTAKIAIKGVRLPKPISPTPQETGR